MADRRMQGSTPDYYRVLGVGYDSSHDELRRAWRDAVKRWHPDRNRSPDAHRMMARINEAWDVLGDPDRRAKYDAVYFSMRARFAEQENREREQSERDRRERERREATERQRAYETERQRQAERERRERERAERDRRERMRREREQLDAEERQRKAEAERVERERKAREKAAGDQRKQEAKRRRSEARRHQIEQAGSLVAYVRQSVRQFFGSRLRGLKRIDKLQIGLGFALGVFVSAILILVLILFSDVRLPWTTSNVAVTNVGIVDTAGWGTVYATGSGAVDCTAYGRNARNVAAFGDSPRAEVLFLTPDATEWSAGFLYHLSASGFSAAVLRRTGDEFRVRHWRQTSEGQTAIQESRFRPDLLHPGGSNVPNDFRLEVSDTGSDVIANGFVLVHVARHDLSPVSSAVHFCAGWFGDEPAYTVQFVGLRGTVEDGTVDPEVFNPVEYWPARPASTQSQTDSAATTAANRVSVSDILTLQGSHGGGVISAVRGSINCATDAEGIRRDIAYGENFVGEVELMPPNIDRWTLGFLYHNSGSGYSAGLIQRQGPTYGAVHWTQVGADATSWQEAPADRASSQIRSASNAPVTLRIQASEDGTTMLINGIVLLQVSANNLRPYPSGVHFCVGFYDDEPGYEVRYSWLRGTFPEASTKDSPTPSAVQSTAAPTSATRVAIATATARAAPRPTPVPLPTGTPEAIAESGMPELALRGSGTLNQDASDGFIGCPRNYSDPAFIAHYATEAVVEFQFKVPAAARWSIGMVYHVAGDDDAITYVYRSGLTTRVAHSTRVNGENVDSVDFAWVSPDVLDPNAGAVNLFAFRVDQEGADVRLNGSVVLEISPTDLRLRNGEIEVCAGFLTDESEDYEIDYTGMRAWTD